jgi:EAL domain-containing protein (putative c-di-GMP-specific phosphodiesterase class I)
VEFEITEGMLMSNLDSNIAKMHHLKEKGFYLSIDDFGTGYSCLSYLKSLPISKLKIDQSFTRDLASDRNDRSIVQTIIMMAQTMELDVLAEGVETREQFDFLNEHGCHKYQGYYFGKPVSANEFLQKWIQTSSEPTLVVTADASSIDKPQR